MQRMGFCFRMFTLAITVVLSLVTILNCFADQNQVEAQGYAAIELSPQQAKQDALHDAQRNAVSQTLGNLITSETLVENAMLIEDKILTRVEGYVRDYTLLSEVLSDRTCSSRIRAQVEKMALADDVAALARILPRMNYPTLAVSLTEDSFDAGGSRTALNLQAAQQTIESQLRAKGFQLVNLSALEQERLRQGQLHNTSGKTAEEGSHKAQILVTGRASVQDNGPSPYSDRFHAYAATITADICETASGKILASASAQAVVPHHSFAIGAQNALQKAAMDISDKLCAQVVATWLDACYNEHMVTFIVEQCPFPELATITSALSGLSGVTRTEQKQFLSQRAEFIVGWQSCNTLRLAEKINGLSIGSHHLEVAEANSYVIRAVLK
ncbi:MAG: hypothetical protein JXR59_04495 [Desulfuromonadaceae bacterium]|nr:hypothetical protein [Desulfuromonadaceae bacterium]